MKLSSFRIRGTATYGVVTDSEVIDLGAHPPVFMKPEDVVEVEASRIASCATPSPRSESCRY